MMAKARVPSPHPQAPSRRGRARHPAAHPAAPAAPGDEVGRAYLRFGDEEEHAAEAPAESEDLPAGGVVDQRVYQALDARHRAQGRRRARAHAASRDECP